MNVHNDYNRWTLEEDNLLTETYSEKSYVELSEIFGRTMGSVKARSSRLGLKRNTHRKTLVGERYGKLLVIERTNNRNKHECPLYKCKCDCGSIHYLASNALNHKRGTRSCGCEIYTGEQMRKSYGESSFNNLFSQYKNHAEKRDYKWKLNKEEFKCLTKSNCYYCGSPPLQVHNGSGNGRNYGEYIYNGVDRMNNDKGYFIDNCVSCCGKCNRAKDIMSKEEFFNLIESIYNHSIKKP